MSNVIILLSTGKNPKLKHTHAHTHKGVQGFETQDECDVICKVMKE